LTRQGNTVIPVHKDMKVRLIITSAAVLLAALLLYLFILRSGNESGERFEPSEWEKMVETQLDRNLENYFSKGELPEGQEKEFIIWAFEKNGVKIEAFIRRHARNVPNLPWHLSDASWDMVRKGEQETGMRILSLARDLYPNNPDVLGITGIIAYLGGDRANARLFLEEAESWRSNRPIVDFYLGGLLVMSDTTADRTRGKAILMDLLKGADTELRELSGLTLISNINIPMIKEDLEAIYSLLEKNEVFYYGNPNLPPDVLRVMINRLVPHFPERALDVADLLLKYPNTNVEDLIGVIRLCQAMGLTEKARTHLAALQSNASFMSLINGDKRLEQMLAVEAFLEEKHFEGLAMVEAIVTDPGLEAQRVQEMFKNIVSSQPPMSAETEVLKLYLKVPAVDPATSIGVLNRLRQIAPLGEKEWIAHAIEHLMEKDPIRVGGWLTEINAGEAVIEALGDGISGLSPDEASVLINAYIAIGDLENAHRALQEGKGLVDPVVAAYHRARLLLQEDKKDEAIEYWEAAHQGIIGSNRFPLIKDLGMLAMQLDQPVHAMQSLYTALTAGIPFSQQEAGRLTGLTLKYGNLRQTIRVAEYLERNYPAVDLHKNNLAYFKFLAEEQVDESVEVMRSLVEAYPDIPQYRLTLALGLVKAGRTNEANRLLKSTNIDWKETSTRGLLIYAVVLAASDQRTVAEGLLQNLDTSILIPEEMALLESL
jgi:tetratricopeptide (TPR) repeat protein